MLEICRTRLCELIESARQRPITLIVGPAGSGKSLAIRDFLSTVEGPYRTFDLRRSEGEFKRWLGAECATFEGIVTVDALEAASCAVSESLVAVIPSTHGRIRWILASRSTAQLPIGRWLGYDVAAPILSHGDLRFSADEIEALATAQEITIAPREREEILHFTQGWAIATAFAVRAFGHGSDIRTVRNETREMMSRFLDEHVATTLDPTETELLEAAALLPSMDALVLEQAGFDRPLRMLGGISVRTALLWEDAGGRVACDGLLLDHFKRRVSTMERAARDRLYGRLAATFETLGDVAEALNAYSKAGLRADVIRLLERDGFDLIDRARTEAVAHAIESLDERTRRNNPRILALRGVVHSSKGRPARAESLLRRSLACAGDDHDAKATTSLRLAVLVANRGDEVNALVGPIANDPLQSAEHRAEALSVLAAQRALAGDAQAATTAAAGVQELLPQIAHDITRAKVLQRIGVAAVNTGDVERARVTLEEAADLAKELELHSVASRAWATLFNLIRHHYDDSRHQDIVADEGIESAEKSGNTFDLHTALAQKLSSTIRLGYFEKSLTIEGRLNELPIGDNRRNHYVVPLRAIRMARDGNFQEAHRLLAPSLNFLHYDFDRVSYTGQCALFLAMDDRREASNALTAEVLSLIDASARHGVFGRRQAAMALLYCAVAESVKGRVTHAERLVGRIRTTDAVTSLTKKVASIFVAAVRQHGHCSSDEVSEVFTQLQSFGYADTGSVLVSVNESLRQRGSYRERLSAAETKVLALLSEGLSTKEIAARTGRSVFTVRVHIANAAAKLKCHGRMQAVAVARRLALIP